MEMKTSSGSCVPHLSELISRKENLNVMWFLKEDYGRRQPLKGMILNSYEYKFTRKKKKKKIREKKKWSILFSHQWTLNEKDAVGDAGMMDWNCRSCNSFFPSNGFTQL